MLNLVLFGAPGSGKGTQSAKLVDRYGLYHISTGDLLRDHICAHTDLGRIADKYISQGELIPDELMISILDEELNNENVKDKNGVIFDGFPRTIAQAEALAALLEKRGQKVHAVIGLEVPEDELVKRMLKRGEETHRDDDNLDTIKRRLEVYHSQTKPLRDFYTESGHYVPIDGLGVVEEIFEEISRNIDKRAE